MESDLIYQLINTRLAIENLIYQLEINNTNSLYNYSYLNPSYYSQFLNNNLNNNPLSSYSDTYYNSSTPIRSRFRRDLSSSLGSNSRFEPYNLSTFNNYLSSPLSNSYLDTNLDNLNNFSTQYNNRYSSLNNGSRNSTNTNSISNSTNANSSNNNSTHRSSLNNTNSSQRSSPNRTNPNSSINSSINSSTNSSSQRSRLNNTDDDLYQRINNIISVSRTIRENMDREREIFNNSFRTNNLNTDNISNATDIILILLIQMLMRKIII